MAQPANTAAAGDLKAKPRTSSRVSSALKSGVVYGGSAVLTAVNNITPHIAGAVDILVIEQPDGSRKATPFYVRFGKYTALRTRERNVKLYINDELAPFGMHIGMYGQAYFATETVEVREGDDDEQEALLAGMMSPPSGYSSGADEAATHADGGEAGATLSAVRQRIDGMKEARRASGRSAAGARSSSRGPRVPLPALGADVSSAEETAAAAPASDERSAGVPPGQVQLAPALSMADRNESFLSARETLATPLGDELVANALGPLSPALPASPERRMRASRSESQLLGQQGQGPGARASSGSVPRSVPPHGGSTNSLQTVSEGASPCGWSEEEEEEEPVGEEEEEQEPSREGESTGGVRRGAEAAAPAPGPHALQQQNQGHSQNQLHHHSGLHQPLHQQLGFPENGQAAGGATAAGADAAPPLSPLPCPGLNSGSSTSLEPAGRPKLHATVDWAQVLGPAAGAGSGHAPGTVPLPPLAGQPSAAGVTDATAAQRHGPCSAAQRASPGAGLGGLAASLGHDDQGPGSGPGSHSAISLLSSSLRGGGSGVSLVGLDGRVGPAGGGRSSLEWLRAASHVAAAEPQAPSAFVQPQAAAAAVAATGGQPLVASAADNGPMGPIAAAAVAAMRPPPAEAPLSLSSSQSEREPSSSGVSLYLTATEEGEVRVRLTVTQQQLLPSQPPSGTERQPGEGAVGGVAVAAGAGAAAVAVSRKVTPAGSDSGYLGDVERVTRAATATPVPQHHHVSHHHHYTHVQGHGHARHDHHHEFFHSASAPLPSSTIDAAAGVAAVAEAVAASAAASGGAATAAARPAMAAHGIELSLCGIHLTASMSYTEATVLFDAHRVSEELFFSRAQLLAGGSELAIRLSNGVIFPCQPLSHSLLGLLAFGTWRLPPGTPCWAPDGADSAGASEAAATSAAAAAAAAMLAAAVAQGAGVAAAAAAVAAPKNGATGAASSAATTPKKGQAAAGTGGGSWRLWMFGTRREGARASATGGSTSGVATSISGRSPPLTSPIAERQGSIEHRTAGAGAGVEAAPPPALPPASAALPPAQPSAAQAEGGGGAAAAAAVAAADAAAAGAAAAGGTSRDDGGQSAEFNVVTKKSLTPTSEQLAALPLKHGQNTIMYKVGGSELRAYVYFLPWRTRIVISDIDGTITKSDVLGHLLPAMGLDWSHPGIAQLLTNIRQNNYLIMYLSSRSISQANITRDFINTLVQGEHRMPLGPVIISPHGLLPSLYREMILRRPHEFKIATLQDIRALFPPDWNPFYGGFGNRDTDEISYREVGVQPSRIFIINPRGELRQPIDSAPREALQASGSAAAAAAGAADAKSEDAASDGGNGSGGADPPSDAGLPPPPAARSPTAAAAAPVSRTTREIPGRSSGPAPAAAAALPVREASSRSVGAAGSVGRRASGSAAAAAGTVALSTLSAINEFVHDIFPPLRDGEPTFSSEDEDGSGDKSEAAGGSGDEGAHEGGSEGEARMSAIRQRRSGSVESGEGGAGDGADVWPGGEGDASGASEAALSLNPKLEARSSPEARCPSPPAAVTPRSAASPRGSRAPSSVASESEAAAATPAASPGALPAAVDTEDLALERSVSPASCSAGEQQGGLVAEKSGAERGSGAFECAGQPAARGGACSVGGVGGGSPGGLPGPNVMDEVVATAVPLPA